MKFDGAQWDDAEWEDLLRYIRAHRVIPVIGPELITVQEGNATLPLVHWLAPRLAEQLRLPEPSRFNSLNEVACSYLITENADRRRMYNGLRSLLQNHVFEPPPALLQLAAITDFDLFIATTFDPLLVQAMEKSRPGFARSRDVMVFNSKPSTTPFPNPVPASLVYYILGNVDSFPDFCVWEEDFMEYLCCLVAQSHDTSMEGLFRLLGDRHLLLLGAPYSDWVVHFFLRAARGSRLTGSRKDDATEVIADSPANLGGSTLSTVLFFNNQVKATRIIDSSPTVFVEELARRWHAERDLSAQDFLSRMAREMPRGDIFLSYSRDDLAAARHLAMRLKENNIPVWMDTERLRLGENYENTLELTVRDSCSFFLALISPATESDQHRYVHKERAWAAQRHVDGFVFYLPLVLEGTPEPGHEPPCFREIHRETIARDGTPNNELIQRLRALMESWRSSGRPRA